MPTRITIQKNPQNQLTERKFLSLLSKRKFLSDTDAQKLARLQKGYEGEQMALEFLKKYGHANWKILQNIWLGDENIYETDLLILGNMGWLTLEIKNYDGQFHYENGICKREDFTMSHNIVSQAQRILLNNRYLAQRLPMSAKTTGALVFIGEHNDVQINGHVTEIDIVPRNHFKFFLGEMVKLEKRARNNDLVEKSLELINRVAVPSPFEPRMIDEHERKFLKKGIHCPECGNFDYIRLRYNFVCTCGVVEGFRDAVLRTLDDYCQLFHHKNLQRKEVLEFLDNQVSKTHLVNILKSNYQIIRASSYTEYLNPYKKT